MTFEFVCQIMIFTTSVPAIIGLAIGGKWKRPACVIGIMGYPFWAYSSWTYQQYGIFILALWYAISYAIGIWKKN